MVQEFNDIIPLLDDPKNSVVRGKYDLALMPGNVRRGTNNAGWLVGIPVGSKHPKEAGKLIEFLVSMQAQTAMCRTSGTLSGRKSVIDFLIKTGKSGRPKGDPYGKARWAFYKQVIAMTYELPRTPKEPAIETILGQALSSALTQQQSAKDAMKTAAKAISRL
jgi:ABC-type glycerol-3-phosphate transport system substrate-binding protein